MPKIVHVCISHGSGFVIIDMPNSTRDTACAVVDVPDNMSAASVIRKLHGLTFFPWPKQIVWPDVADLPSGSIVNPKPPP